MNVKQVMLVMNVLLIGIVGKAGNEDDAGNIGKAEKHLVSILNNSPLIFL